MAEVRIDHAGPAPGEGAAGTVASETITDAKGRVLALRELTLLQEQDLLVAMGAEHAANSIALGRALVAARVASIDGSPIAAPASNATYRAMLQRVGKEGLAAVLATVREEGGEDDAVALAKN